MAFGVSDSHLQYKGSNEAIFSFIQDKDMLKEIPADT